MTTATDAHFHNSKRGRQSAVRSTPSSPLNERLDSRRVSPEHVGDVTEVSPERSRARDRGGVMSADGTASTA
jgi:hypothetical protein